MNWYRVTFRYRGPPSRIRSVELQAHSASDATACGLVKAGLHDHGESEVHLVGLECIDVPNWAREAIKAAENMVRDA